MKGHCDKRTKNEVLTHEALLLGNMYHTQKTKT